MDQLLELMTKVRLDSLAWKLKAQLFVNPICSIIIFDSLSPFTLATAARELAISVEPLLGLQPVSIFDAVDLFALSWSLPADS